MPIRILDPKATKEIDVSGSKVVIRGLTVGQKSKLAFTINEKGLLNTPIEDFVDAIAVGVVSIEGCEGDIRDILLSIESLEDFWKITGAVLSFSSLNENEEKNSFSSSDAEKMIPAGSATPVAVKEKKSASTTRKIKL